MTNEVIVGLLSLSGTLCGTICRYTDKHKIIKLPH